MKDFIISVSGNRARQQKKIGLALEGKPQLKSSLSKIKDMTEPVAHFLQVGIHQQEKMGMFFIGLSMAFLSTVIFYKEQKLQKTSTILLMQIIAPSYMLKSTNQPTKFYFLLLLFCLCSDF